MGQATSSQVVSTLHPFLVIGVDVCLSEPQPLVLCFPLGGPGSPGTACGVLRAALLTCRKVGGSARFGSVSLQPLLQGRVLGTIQSWGEESWRPSVLSKLRTPPGRLRWCEGTLAELDQPWPWSLLLILPLPILPCAGPPGGPYLGCLGHNWLCPLLWHALGSVIGSTWQVNLFPAPHVRRWPSQGPSSCTVSQLSPWGSWAKPCMADGRQGSVECRPLLAEGGIVE